MATVNFSVPDEIKEAFQETFAKENRSAIIARLMKEAVEDRKRQERQAAAARRFAATPDEPSGAGIAILPDIRGLYRFYEELALRFAEREEPSLMDVWLQAPLPPGDTAVLEMAFTIELANGSYGYLPTPEQHELGGYETWLGTNRVETEASRKIVAQILKLFAQVQAAAAGRQTSSTSQPASRWAAMTECDRWA